ncbi:hypothetical protein K450DRAFT_255206 [Umbelopsis ramanniana AG]|uniref:Phospholipase n=1 Tax=Umbelopsis ramanniana AG TaxID=1314678 RepID=A0AAD5E4Q7_UMBRA|nr:uncharacterized protein K450DRAFT_255206 [Umbelopsis ramanniana AG]KAI8576832.1 hypothetical protein K450DRAFT_255206 [Umbelopsis ramanniana AG]
MFKLTPGDANSHLPEAEQVNATAPDNQQPPSEAAESTGTSDNVDTTQQRTEGQQAQNGLPPAHHQDQNTNGKAPTENGSAPHAAFDDTAERPSMVDKVKGVMSGGFSKNKRPQLNTRDLTFWDSDLNSEDMDTTSISDLRKTKSNTSQTRRKKSNAAARSDNRNSVGVASLRSSLSGRSKPSENANSIEMNEKKDVDNREPNKNEGATGDASTSSAVNFSEKTMDQPDDTSTQPSKNAANRWGKLRNTIRFQNQLQSKGRSNTDALREAKRNRTGADVITENLLNIQPAMIIGMAMQRDEHKSPRIPVVLSQLKIRITDSEEPLNRSRATFRIELEYGDGLMKWVIQRRYRDFLNLHYSYRRYDPTRTRIKGLPKFPKHSLPYFIGYRDDDDASSSDLEDDVEDDDVARRASRSEDNIALKKLAGHLNAGDNDSDDPRRPNINHHNTSFFSFRSNHSGDHAVQQAKFSAEQRKTLESYLIDLTRCLMFRGEANRLCKFFEISALGVQLAADGGYQGKEGYMMVERRSDQIPSAHRAAFCGVHFKNIHKRLTPKWFLTRHSYIACVDEPDSSIIYDVLLVDSEFKVERHRKHANTLEVQNSQRVMHLRAKNETQATQFYNSLKELESNCIWRTPNQRFDSFAPIRYDCNAQWLVDGRNYFWNVAKAIANAKEEIYIHDWWLSAELYMRRPAAHNFKWRLDRLLQRKAKQGVKIYIIMYKEVSITLPLYSHYAKEHLLSLSPNIFVMRHPSHLGIAGKTATFFWAHHEKICVIDNHLAFLGGIDLCFGRWDTPTHVLVDERDAKLDKNVKNPQIWHGKDYSNPRILDFHTLDKPEEDNMDRDKIPRMPWHDISMQVVGQPARDVARHFVQRWNFLRSKKAPKRPTPYLLPKPDYTPAELKKLNLTGTCEVQILRSSSSWSIGYRDRVEHSIHDAYVKSIQESEHLVYIENQFFVTSTVIGNTTVENKIGDALVERILRAHEQGDKWRAIIVIPLVPAFQSNVDEPDGMSIRMIMMCQYRSICRGEHSIYGRLKAKNINPDDYITFYSLRNWGSLGGEFVTEQVYIHAKTMVVDDRIVIIGSANINERSQRGNRDSEIAAYVRDSNMVESRLGGKPYQVGHFAHTLRLRLMQEHLGVDVDAIEVEQIQNGDIDYVQFGSDEEEEDDEEDQGNDGRGQEDEAVENEARMDKSLHDIGENRSDRSGDAFDHEKRGENEPTDEDWPKVPVEGDWDEGEAKASNERTAEKQEKMSDQFASGAGKRVGPAHETENKDSAQGTQAGPTDRQSSMSAPNEHRSEAVRVVPPTDPSFNEQSEADASAPSQTKPGNDQSPASEQQQASSQPLSPVPSNTSTAAGLVSHINVDQSNILTQDNSSTSSQKQQQQEARVASDREKEQKFWKSVQMDDVSTDPLPSLDIDLLMDPLDDDFFIHLWQRTANHNTDCYRRVFLAVPDDNVTTWARYKEFKEMTEKGLMGHHDLSDLHGSHHAANVAEGGDIKDGEVDPRGKALVETTGKTEEQVNQQVHRIEDILAEIRGNLVIFPTKFMEAEDDRNDFLFNTDKLAPIDIFD